MAQQIGSKVIVVDGQQVTVRVFAPNVRHEMLPAASRSWQAEKAIMAELDDLRRRVAEADKAARSEHVSCPTVQAVRIPEGLLSEVLL